MAWLRMWFDLDRRLLLAALGLAAALLLPATATLVLSGLEPDQPGHYLLQGRDLRPAQYDGADLVVKADATHAAIVVGEPIVGPGQPAPAALDGGTARPLIPLDAVLVHRDDLDAPVRWAWFEKPVPGSVPASGGDAFEAQGVASLQELTVFILIGASLGAVLVTVVYALADADARTLPASLFSALGHAGAARALLVLRVLALVAGAGIVAVLVTFVLWIQGGTFRPVDTPKLQLAWSFLIPGAAAALAGTVAVMWRLRDPLAILQSGSDTPASPGLRFLPAPVRPLALGTRLLPVLLVAAILFSVEIALPLAAAAIPAQVAGGSDEWVQGVSDGVPGSPTPAGPGQVLHHHPAVDASVAEVLLPTTVNGHAAMVRGGEGLAIFHGVQIRGDDSGLVLGSRLAQRAGLSIGSVADVQGRGEGILTRVEVTGIMAGLDDEAFLPLTVAQRLAGLPEDKVDVVRVRPATAEAEAAMGGTPRIEFTQVEVLEVRGAVGRIGITAINLDDQAASRTATIRIQGYAAAIEEVRLGPWEQRVHEVWVPVPPGDFRVDVNPTTHAQGGDGALRLEASFDGAVHVQAWQEGAPLVGIEVGLATDAAAVAQGTWLATATTATDGRATLPSAPGEYLVAATDGRALTRITVPFSGPDLRIEGIWTDPAVPKLGDTARIHIQAFNAGDQTAVQAINVTQGETVTTRISVQVEPGQRVLVHKQIVIGVGKLAIDGQPLASDAREVQTRPIGVQPGGAAQQEAADRVLGDAQTAIGSLAFVAIASSVAVISIGTRRILAERRHVIDVLLALGEPAYRVRQRITWEAGIQAGLAGLMAILLAKAMFVVFDLAGAPLTFAHVPSDPFDGLATFQVLVAFVAAAAVPAHITAQSMVDA